MNSVIEVLIENILGYFIAIGIIALVVIFYLRSKRSGSKAVEEKINEAKEAGLFEPVSLHPVIDYDICIGSAACVAACPEKDILGIVDGRAKTINASQCVGHGACFHACPLEAISLYMGTEKRGVDLPNIKPTYETNVQGIFIAGELGGMGLIKNAVEQGRQAMENLTKTINSKKQNENDVIIIGAGPAGISAALTAKKNNLNFKVLDQDSLGGTVYSFPRAKLVMTSPMELPLYGKIKLSETSKDELINLWKKVLNENNITINENEKVDSIEKEEESFKIKTANAEYKTSKVLLAIGRRGSPRKLGCKGEDSDKVFYKLLEPELIVNKDVLVVGGGDSAIETALLVLDEGKNNRVTLSYRSDSFKRCKPKNRQRIHTAAEEEKLNIIFNSNVKEVKSNSVVLTLEGGDEKEINNDLVYVFAGGILPNKFLESAGIEISKKFGEAVLKH